ncbi:MAG: hypothetical protein IJV85_02600 [Clostridia bacterium]|nr:hypothetical protein [Clostridia bacterium]
MTDKIKIKVSSFVANILENDALRFGFLKNEKSNKNALLNKLIPTLVEVRKARRNEIEYILKSEYNREDSENIYSAVNTVIDRVYFEDEELNVLEEYIWIRPSKETIPTYDEIETSETIITAQEIPVYIRGLLNEYSQLPQYKREILTFNRELGVFADACETRQILHFRDKETSERYKAFAFGYYYGYLYDQTNYCIIYDINNKTIKAIPLYQIQDIYTIKQKYKPSERLIEQLQSYTDNCDFEEEISVGVDENVF